MNDNNPTPIGPPTTASVWLDRLAMLVSEIRPDWQTGGVRSALLKVADRPLREVALAALAATSRTDQHSPAVIALDGPHWRLPGIETRPPVVRPDPSELCDVCDRLLDDCRRTNALVAPEHRHEFRPQRVETRKPRTTRLRPSEPVEPAPDALDLSEHLSGQVSARNLSADGSEGGQLTNTDNNSPRRTP